MEVNIRKNWYWFLALVLIIAFSAIINYQVERDWGEVDISMVEIETSTGYVVVAKLYRPVTATAENPLPLVVNMHGYQNDKGVQDAFSIELSRRGFVVLAPDSLGHGDSEGGISVAFTNPDIVMGNTDALMYGISLPFVDAENVGVMGHSMGGGNASSLAELFPDIVDAVNPHASNSGTPEMSNVLVTTALWEEFFREGDARSETLTSNETRLANMGLGDMETIEWDTTYGSFEDGTARRMPLININHHLTTLSEKAVAEAVDWMRLSLKGGDGGTQWIDPYKQVFLVKEAFGFITLVGTMATLIPLTNLLLATVYFKPVAQPLPKKNIPDKRTWWRLATINMLIGGILYPLTTNRTVYGKVAEWFPFMKLAIGNAVALFFLANAVVATVLFWLWYRNAKKEGVTMYDMGVSFDEEKTVIDWGIIGKTVLLGAILFLWMYIFEGFFQHFMDIEFRIGWPYMRQFATLERVKLFFIYLIPALLFFLINGGVFLFGQAKQEELETPVKTQVVWWLKAVYAMVTGLFLVWCIQYLPWMFGAAGGPGFEVLGLDQFSGMFPLMLWVYIPEFIILFFFHTWFYKRTGRIYLGALVVASLAVWFLTAGSVVS